MLKQGKYRALRNIPVGWILQAVHSTDKSERWFRILVELLLFVLVLQLIGLVTQDTNQLLVWGGAFLFVHTVSWFITGNFWVYMLDSFYWVHNPGVVGVVRFTRFSEKVFTSIDCVDAILIYGSMCRGQLHGRSDLDLRVLRRTDSWKGLFALPLGYFVRLYSFFIRMPVDLEVVDSMAFISRQMRADESPIAVYIRHGVHIEGIGLSFDEVEKDPSIVLKKEG